MRLQRRYAQSGDRRAKPSASPRYPRAWSGSSRRSCSLISSAPLRLAVSSTPSTREIFWSVSTTRWRRRSRSAEARSRSSSVMPSSRSSARPPLRRITRSAPCRRRCGCSSACGSSLPTASRCASASTRARSSWGGRAREAHLRRATRSTWRRASSRRRHPDKCLSAGELPPSSELLSILGRHAWWRPRASPAASKRASFAGWLPRADLAAVKRLRRRSWAERKSSLGCSRWLRLRSHASLFSSASRGSAKRRSSANYGADCRPGRPFGSAAVLLTVAASRTARSRTCSGKSCSCAKRTERSKNSTAARFSG